MKALSLIGLFLTLIPAWQVLAEPLRLEIEMGDYRFRPDKIEATVGREVMLRLHNSDRFIPHDFVLEAPEAGLDIAVDVPPGASKTVRFTPTAAGFFPFHCSKRLLFFKSHRARGMHGLLMVTRQ